MFSLSQNYLTRGFWGDEAWTSLISQLPFQQMLKTTAADFHPPGYYTIVELVYKFLPPTEIITRSISIIFYLLTVFLVYKLASEIKGRMFGLISAVVVLVNPIFFTYAFEARNYTMFAFAATGSIYCLIKLSSVLGSRFSENKPQKTDNRKRLWTLFVLFSTLGIYTHYYMFFILAAQGLYLILFDRKILLRMIWAYAVVAVLYFPWIPFLEKQVTSVGQSYWIGAVDRRTHFEALLRILGGENKNILRPFLFWLSLTLIAVGLAQHIRQKSFERSYRLVWLWAVVPFILATLPGLAIDGFKLPFRPIFFWRYLIGSSVPISLIIVHASQKLPKNLFKLSMVAIVVLGVAIDGLTFNRSPYTFREAYREKVLGKIKATDKIVTVLPSFAEVLYYRNRNNLNNELIVLPEGLVQFSGKSLLDAYNANGKVKIDKAPNGRYFELRPGPSIVKIESQSFD
ncbi:hypothetical protein A2697_00425 [Candidatus Curtissbacteria bacterium RIFCSPHIGHO2_01_FULL_41_44]|uniref:Glycosyltransferase RgtA/B/C/D-like domain-containing protein n=1 Tax=Candidatus Curtissbacteria bacterium RIFCSPLOWO2_01_FULL_42_50 TaxID=1797730 RepID=A0A1F5H4R5_9BACT|nr:MAG: hypothetical protein A2697_00425 [Candidatus Curtissbacteria bacterium RIFCSPHIGHO2_01_FULL_41_44]OGD93577.1 MAG: hypothetical protein A3C33_01515 [Candidatus Curtissbacteria bacterium RIFCSPHIGHO2_02_FULL_42_58]OGD97164.1 MAG: hypothetical protein A3E71_04950 [Candidatus Curtissbacteria bacterium RIFCSPHIGHO2_12_FULL_42_33]OGD99078.1 MAG: hypothetical protein A3B54_05195 [Candidatus Curtissbacteria bacterium RIFCSPLOWO2_01_FULL_42_50]OGE02289.1 MAG: hypothetical protein A3G16_01340 [Ca